MFDNAVGVLEIDCKTVEAMFAKAAAIANERGEGLAGGETAPTRPAFPEDPAYPEEPTLGTLPEQLALVLPDEPEDKSGESMAAWQQACDEVRAQFEADRNAWGLSYLQVYADYVNSYRSWKEECERIQEEYQQQVLVSLQESLYLLVVRLRVDAWPHGRLGPGPFRPVFGSSLMADWG